MGEKLLPLKSFSASPSILTVSFILHIKREVTIHLIATESISVTLEILKKFLEGHAPGPLDGAPSDLPPKIYSYNYTE